MDADTLTLLAMATFAAALVQVTTGIGFGIVAAPCYLLAFPALPAVQMTSLVTLGSIAPTLPGACKAVSRRTFTTIAAGSALGLPVGVVVVPLLGETSVRAMIAALLGIVTLLILVKQRTDVRIAHQPPAYAAGIACGAAASICAIAVGMPGPVLVAYLLLRGTDMDSVRGTSLLLIAVFSVGGLAVHALGPGILSSTVGRSALLLPAALVGSALGHRLAGRVQARALRRAVICVLFASVVVLVAPLALLPT